MKNRKLDDVIDIAIEREEEACAFYRDLYSRVEDETARETLDFLSKEEKKHKEFLMQYKAGTAGSGGLRMVEFIDYKIAEHLDAPDIEKNMESKDVYLVAAHRELNSYTFYRSLADLHPRGDVKNMLLRIASEEMKHKEKVEYLYSNTAFPQTAGG
ncbi:MAG: ferritin family protein [Syntrophales bacterium]|nr:ferritin family protein [Syntrophales bacterium]MCK9527186.1 ferritin family protein [Syntrophales bacterium]MDX9921689.1 ferritin family protein [Syntrophales bacterium]